MRNQLTNIGSDEENEEAEKPSPEPYLAPYFSTPAYETERDPTRLPLFIPPERSWLTALLDAIGSPSTTPRTKTLWHTQWGNDAEATNPPGHAAYLAYVSRFTAERMPWLIPLFDAAGAIVSVWPGAYLFMVDNYPGAFFTIGELQPYTYLLPWATADEQKRAH